MGRRGKKLLTFGALTVLLLPFQNCTPGQFEVSDSVAEISEGSSLVDAVPDPTPTPAPVPGAKVYQDVFMASGHVGRTVFSCDDGQTWIHDRSDNADARCWVTADPNYVECDHSVNAGHGVDYANGWFYANFGWGYNGSLRKSQDGVNWQNVRTDGWGGGIAAFENTLLLFWGSWSRSVDNGATWSTVQNSPASTLDHATLFRIKDKFVAVDRQHKILTSLDQGATWTAGSLMPDWSNGLIAEGNGLLVTVGNVTAADNKTTTLYAAVSSDGGETWTSKSLFTGDWLSFGGLLFNGTNFIAWQNGVAWKSADGVNWTSQAMTSTGTYNVSWLVGPFSFNPKTGTYVSIPNNWGRYYDGQKAFRSQDGVNWTELGSSQFHGGHPLNNITLGVMDSEYCQ